MGKATQMKKPAFPPAFSFQRAALQIAVNNLERLLSAVSVTGQPMSFWTWGGRSRSMRLVARDIAGERPTTVDSSNLDM
jgi:hypothetical protein